MSSGTDVPTQIDPPKPGAIQLDAVDIHLVCFAALGVVLGVGRVPLQKDLILPVAICIAHRAVVGRVSTAAAGGWIQIQLKIIGVGGQLTGIIGLHRSAGKHFHPISIAGAAALVQVAGGIARIAGVYQGIAPVQPEHCIVRIVGKEPPVHQHAGTGIDGANAPIQVLHHTAFVCGSGDGHSMAHTHRYQVQTQRSCQKQGTDLFHTFIPLFYLIVFCFSYAFFGHAIIVTHHLYIFNSQLGCFYAQLYHISCYRKVEKQRIGGKQIFSDIFLFEHDPFAF